MKKPARWRLWSSLALFVLAALMIWPTIRWYSLPEIERDCAEASVQPETDNPYYRSLLDSLRVEGGQELIDQYKDLHGLKDGTIKLGLDLQGGMYLAYTVEPVEGMDEDEAIDQALEVIRNRINEFGVSEPSITKQGSDRIVVQLPGVRDPGRAREIVEKQALLEFKLVVFPNDEQTRPGDVRVIRQIDSFLAEESGIEIPEEPEEPEPAAVTDPADAPPAPADTAGGLQLPRTEPAEGQFGLDDLQDEGPSGQEEDIPQTPSIELPREGGGLSGLLVQVGEGDARALAVSPGDWAIPQGEALDVFNEIVHRPEVDSMLAEQNLEFALKKPGQTSQGMMVPVFLVPRDVTRGTVDDTDDRHPEYHLTGANLEDVRVRTGGAGAVTNEPYLILQFDGEGSENWERITGENVQERVAILLDGTVYSVATIRERISGAGGTRLSGGFDLQEAKDLRLVLRAGSLPASLEIAEEQTIGPSLGRRSIDQGMMAAILGLALVALFIIVYYGVGGVLAVLALVFDMLLVLAVLCFPGPLSSIGMTGLNATLTLPGIAGIILTIGMAVDASVLIYERIREERDQGKSMKASVEAGYGRAFVTILDANLTTLITAMVLYKFGTGPIRGFAVTLSIGILASMFCSLVFTRGVFDLMLRRRGNRPINLGRLHFLNKAAFNITRVRKKTYLLSAGVILIGAIAFFAHGGLSLDIDFTGGLETTVVTDEVVAAEDVSSSLEAEGLQNVQVQRLVDYAGEGGAYVVRTSTSDKEIVDSALDASGYRMMEGAEEGLSFIKQIGPKVGSELRTKAINAIIAAMVFIVLYIWYRFQFKWGIAAVAALTHDIIITIGLLALLQLDVSLTIIAALLTIVGYSINDTIVVFDRIREDRKLRRGKTFEETVNFSINETLSRTVITSLTTFMAVLMLYIFGGATLADFSLTLLMGIIIGTYSSIFVASPILVDWTRKVHKATKRVRRARRNG
jgi:SecD/SecF fusion protein